MLGVADGLALSDFEGAGVAAAGAVVPFALAPPTAGVEDDSVLVEVADGGTAVVAGLVSLGPSRKSVTYQPLPFN